VGVREYKAVLSSETYLNIEVYDMGLAENAVQIFKNEIFDDCPSPGIGSHSIIGGGALLFQQDRYYVKIRCDSIGEDVDRLLQEAGRYVQKGLTANAGL